MQKWNYFGDVEIRCTVAELELLLRIVFVLQCILCFIHFSKLQKYSPNEAQKVWERPISRKVNHKFNPEKALELLREGSPRLDNIDDDGKRKLLEDFLAVSIIKQKHMQCVLVYSNFIIQNSCLFRMYGKSVPSARSQSILMSLNSDSA